MLKTNAAGEYRQTCTCVSLRTLARKRAKHLQEEANAAMKDAELAEQEGDPGDAVEFRSMAAEARGAALAILLQARRPRGPCIVCADRGEVIGNGTYGGGHKRQHTVVMVL